MSRSRWQRRWLLPACLENTAPRPRFFSPWSAGSKMASPHGVAVAGGSARSRCPPASAARQERREGRPATRHFLPRFFFFFPLLSCFFPQVLSSRLLSVFALDRPRRVLFFFIPSPFALLSLYFSIVCYNANALAFSLPPSSVFCPPALFHRLFLSIVCHATASVLCTGHSILLFFFSCVIRSVCAFSKS